MGHFVDDAHDPVPAAIAELGPILPWESEEARMEDELLDLLEPDGSEEGTATMSVPSEEEKQPTPQQERKPRIGRPKGKGKFVNETPEERKIRLALVNRKYRARKRDKVVNLKRKNEELEEDRSLLLERIANLQMEAQMLRGFGTVSLDKENELLRAEIRRHKRFIQDIVQVTNNASGASDADQDRILLSGMSSALGQTLGLLYTSAADPSWKESCRDFVKGHEVILRTQYLPIGSDYKTASRHSLRLDTFSPNITAKSLVQHLMDHKNARINYLDYVGQLPIRGTTSMEKAIDTRHILQKGNHNGDFMTVLKYTESTQDASEPDTEIICAHTKHSSNVSNAGFPQHMLDANPSFAASDIHEAVMFTTATSTTFSETLDTFVPPSDGTKRLDFAVLKSLVVTDCPNAGSYVTLLISVPAKMDGFLGTDLSEPPQAGGKFNPTLYGLLLNTYRYIGLIAGSGDNDNDNM